MTDPIAPERPVRFFVGLHHPGDARHFARACVSVRTLTRRLKPLGCGEVLLDSGAFTELNLYGGYRTSVKEYADQIRRLHDAGIVKITAAVAQDYMCEAFMLAKTGMTVADHQRLTIIPVLQGYAPADYVRHVLAYGDRLTPGMWVGVGSVCKRNGRPELILDVLAAIKSVRPDLRLHGFGVKQTALLHPGIRELLYSADSMAWSYAARREGRKANDWHEAKTFADRMDGITALAPEPWQPRLSWDFAA
jgi:hypothetical protein